MLENFKKSFKESEWEDMFLEEFHKIICELRKVHSNVIFIVERIEDKYLFNLFSQINEIQYFQ